MHYSQLQNTNFQIKNFTILPLSKLVFLLQVSSEATASKMYGGRSRKKAKKQSSQIFLPIKNHFIIECFLLISKMDLTFKKVSHIRILYNVCHYAHVHLHLHKICEITPVSYTHLDVYKRQFLYRYVFCSFPGVQVSLL